MYRFAPRIYAWPRHCRGGAHIIETCNTPRLLPRGTIHPRTAINGSEQITIEETKIWWIWPRIAPREDSVMWETVTHSRVRVCLARPNQAGQVLPTASWRFTSSRQPPRPRRVKMEDDRGPGSQLPGNRFAVASCPSWGTSLGCHSRPPILLGGT